MAESFAAFMIEESDEGPRSGFRTIDIGRLPDLDVLVEVACSSLNYKDGLAVTGRGRIARRLPMVAGVDLAGTVVQSRSPEWRPGDRVAVTGHGLSETEWGGYARYHRARADWLTRLPDEMSFIEVMAIGTAGLTAALSVDALAAHASLSGRDVLVTGAGGGVGSFAIMLLAAEGAKVAASTGRPEIIPWLTSLGATDTVERTSLSAELPPLGKERWSAAVDTVGGRTLANVLAATRRSGAVAACGLVGGAELPTTVYPFILRGVSLIGVDSVYASSEARAAAWRRLVRDLDRETLATLYRVEPFARLPELAEEILAGSIRGRVVLDLEGA